MTTSDSEFPGRVAPTPHSLGRPDVQAEVWAASSWRPSSERARSPAAVPREFSDPPSPRSNALTAQLPWVNTPGASGGSPAVLCRRQAFAVLYPLLVFAGSSSVVPEGINAITLVHGHF